MTNDDRERTDAAATAAAQQIDRLRSLRTWTPRDWSILPVVAAAQREAAGVQRRLGELIELWQEMVDPEIASRTVLITLRGGVLHVSADSAAVAYELDRRLREELLTTLRARFRGSLSRVRITVGGA